jgi:hypothetical protein
LNDQNLTQIEVEVGPLHEFGNELAKMLQKNLKTDVELNGSTLVLRDGSNGHLRPKDVKMQIKHVIHHLGFSHEYRVLSDHSVLRIVKVGHKSRPQEKGGSVPNPSQSLPYLFPA